MTASQAAYQRAGCALASMRALKQSAPSGNAAEERGDHRQHGGGFVAQPQRALLRPDDLIAQRREAGCRHQGDGPAPAAFTAITFSR